MNMYQRKFGGYPVDVLLYMSAGPKGSTCVIQGSRRADRGAWRAVTV